SLPVVLFLLVFRSIVLFFHCAHSKRQNCRALELLRCRFFCASLQSLLLFSGNCGAVEGIRRVFR
ncbi:hypothetical protein PMAYCL1PPCAC_22554, partial [Pristionchus mayeri]